MEYVTIQLSFLKKNKLERECIQSLFECCLGKNERYRSAINIQEEWFL